MQQKAKPMGSTKPILKLSPQEQRTFELIPAGGKKISTLELAQKFYQEDGIPWNGRTIISGIVRSLERKTSILRSTYKVCRSKRSGPNPIFVWLEKQ